MNSDEFFTMLYDVDDSARLRSFTPVLCDAFWWYQTDALRCFSERLATCEQGLLPFKKERERVIGSHFARPFEGLLSLAFRVRPQFLAKNAFSPVPSAFRLGAFWLTAFGLGAFRLLLTRCLRIAHLCAIFIGKFSSESLWHPFLHRMMSSVRLAFWHPLTILIQLFNSESRSSRG